MLRARSWLLASTYLIASCSDGGDEARHRPPDASTGGAPLTPGTDGGDGTDGGGVPEEGDSDDNPDCANLEQDFELGDALPIHVTGTLLGATDDIRDASCGFSDGGNGPDHVYRWTAPATGTYRIDAGGTRGEILLSVRDCEGEELACTAVGGEVALYVTLGAGESVWVVVEDPFEGQVTDYQLNVQDACPGADVDLGSAVPIHLSDDTTGRGDDLSGSCAGTGAPDIAYRWTAPYTGPFFVDMYFTMSSLGVYVREADICTVETLQCRDSDVDEFVAFPLVLDEGESVLLAVDGSRTGDAGPFNVRVREMCEPDPESPLVGFPIDQTGTTAGHGDDHGRFCGGSVLGGEDASFAFTPATTATYVFDLAGSVDAASYAIYDPACAPGTLAVCASGNVTGPPVRSNVDLTAGETVSVVVDDQAPSVDYRLHIRYACPAVDADLGNALPLVVDGTTIGESDDYAGDCTGVGDASPDVLYTWTAAASGTYTFMVEGDSSFNPSLSLNSDSCWTDILDCHGGELSGAETITRDLSAGETVTIVIQGDPPTWGAGPFQLRIL